MRRTAHPAERIEVRRSRLARVRRRLWRRADPVALIGLVAVVLFCVAFWAAVAWGLVQLVG